MISFSKIINSLSHNQILLVWKSIHTFLTDIKPGLLDGSGGYLYIISWETYSHIITLSDELELFRIFSLMVMR